MNRRKVKSILLEISVFFNYNGFYVCLMLLTAAGLVSDSRTFTIPVRLLVTVCLLGVLICGSKKRIGLPVRLFFIFMFLYACRILLDMVQGKLGNYYINGGTIFLFLFTFAIFPFFVLTYTKLRLQDYDRILKMIFFSSLVFSIIAFTLYRKYIGQVGMIATSTVGEDVLGHLALAYCSTLGISIGIFYLLNNKVKFWERVYVVIIVCFSVISFILASGRGAAIGLLISFVFFFLSQKNLKRKIKYFLFIAFISLFVIWLINTFGSNLVNRFNDINYGGGNGDNDQDIRLLIWKKSFSQFLDHPLFGSGLVINGIGGYTHEIFIEVLMTTGFLGFIPFIWMVWLAFKKTFYIFRNTPSYSWIGVLFLVSFSQNIFSGAIYSNSWIWFSMALLFSFNYDAKKANAPIINSMEC